MNIALTISHLLSSGAVSGEPPPPPITSTVINVVTIMPSDFGIAYFSEKACPNPDPNPETALRLENMEYNRRYLGEGNTSIQSFSPLRDFRPEEHLDFSGPDCEEWIASFGFTGAKYALVDDIDDGEAAVTGTCVPDLGKPAFCVKLWKAETNGWNRGVVVTAGD